MATAMLTLRAVARVPIAPDVWAHTGETADGSWFGWLGSGAPAAPNSAVVVDDERLLECPGDVPPSALIDVLVEWPFARLASLGEIEIGSVVLLVADDPAASRLTAACRRRGALLCAVWGSIDASGADAVLARPATGESVGRALRQPPDAVIVTTGDAQALTDSLTLVRDRGVVVVAAPNAPKVDVDLYRDVHRRGLTVTIVQPHAYGRAERAAWSIVAPRIWRAAQMEAAAR